MHNRRLSVSGNMFDELVDHAQVTLQLCLVVLFAGCLSSAIAETQKVAGKSVSHSPVSIIPKLGATMTEC